jgi:hypothetical protein
VWWRRLGCRYVARGLRKGPVGSRMPRENNASLTPYYTCTQRLRWEHGTKKKMDFCFIGRCDAATAPNREEPHAAWTIPRWSMQLLPAAVDAYESDGVVCDETCFCMQRSRATLARHAPHTWRDPHRNDLDVGLTRRCPPASFDRAEHVR